MAAFAYVLAIDTGSSEPDFSGQVVGSTYVVATPSDPATSVALGTKDNLTSCSFCPGKHRAKAPIPLTARTVSMTSTSGGSPAEVIAEFEVPDNTEVFFSDMTIIASEASPFTYATTRTKTRINLINCVIIGDNSKGPVIHVTDGVFITLSNCTVIGSGSSEHPIILLDAPNAQGYLDVHGLTKVLSGDFRTNSVPAIAIKGGFAELHGSKSDWIIQGKISVQGSHLLATGLFGTMSFGRVAVELEPLLPGTTALDMPALEFVSQGTTLPSDVVIYMESLDVKYGADYSAAGGAVVKFDGAARDVSATASNIFVRIAGFITDITPPGTNDHPLVQTAGMTTGGTANSVISKQGAGVARRNPVLP